jgi:hypothetical protein
MKSQSSSARWGRAPQADATIRKLAADARSRSREFYREIERPWDHFKRLSVQAMDK